MQPLNSVLIEKVRFHAEEEIKIKSYSTSLYENLEFWPKKVWDISSTNSFVNDKSKGCLSSMVSTWD